MLACVLSYQAINIFVDLFAHFGGQPCRLNFPSVSIGSHFLFYVSAAPTFLLLVQYLTLCWPSLPTMHQASLSSLAKLFLFCLTTRPLISAFSAFLIGSHRLKTFLFLNSLLLLRCASAKQKASLYVHGVRCLTFSA